MKSETARTFTELYPSRLKRTAFQPAWEQGRRICSGCPPPRVARCRPVVPASLSPLSLRAVWIDGLELAHVPEVAVVLGDQGPDGVDDHGGHTLGVEVSLSGDPAFVAQLEGNDQDVPAQRENLKCRKRGDGQDLGSDHGGGTLLEECLDRKLHNLAYGPTLAARAPPEPFGGALVDRNTHPLLHNTSVVPGGRSVKGDYCAYCPLIRI